MLYIQILTNHALVLLELFVHVTFACFPIVAQHVAIRTGTKGGAQRVETGVRTAKIISQTAFVQIFARVSVRRQLGAWTFVAAALVAAVSVAASALTRTVTVTQQTLVVI